MMYFYSSICICPLSSSVTQEAISRCCEIIDAGVQYTVDRRRYQINLFEKLNAKEHLKMNDILFILA